ncbi:MAG: hypothetical protein LBF75_10240 [Treponema sp.]|jgi:hypothetical protein|nr:hypothetical protein [Treponema sp.]
MNRLKVRFFLTVLVVLYILYSQSISHTFYDTRKAGVIKHSYLEILGDPLYLSSRMYAYWEQIIQYLAQSVELTSRALHGRPPVLESY